MANESLNPLRAFDAAHGSELMATLESYLRENAAPEYASAPAFASDVTAVLDAVVADLYHRARLSLFPTLAEGCGLPLLIRQ